MIRYLASDLQGETVENIKNFNLMFRHLMKFRTQAHLKDLLALSVEANNLAFKLDLLTILTEQGKCFFYVTISSPGGSERSISNNQIFWYHFTYNFTIDNNNYSAVIFVRHNLKFVL